MFVAGGLYKQEHIIYIHTNVFNCHLAAFLLVATIITLKSGQKTLKNICMCIYIYALIHIAH